MTITVPQPDRPVGETRITSNSAACTTICRALTRLDARHVFGVPGTQNVALFEALRCSRLATIVPSHEMAAAFMAGAYYRASGRPGVLVTIGGPGLAYALAGLAEARLDSAAVVYLVNGRPADAAIGYGLQALDQRALLAPVVKSILSVTRCEDAADVVAEAFARATSGEPGPVAVELGAVELGGDSDARVAPPRHTSVPPPFDAVRAGQLWTRIAAAHRPVLLLGQGALGAAPGIARLADSLRAPVLTTPSGRGIIDERHPLAMGFDVLKGTLPAVNALLEAADLVVVLGAKLGHNGSAGFGLALPAGRTLRIDSSAAALSSVYGDCQSLCADVAAFIAHSGAHPGTLRVTPAAWSSEEIERWRGRIAGSVTTEAEPLIAGHPAHAFFAGLGAALPDAAMLVTDTGMHQVLARRHFQVRSARGLLTPADFQSMGFGIPAAIAAKLADPSRPIIALTGDGSLRITGLELATAVKARLSLPVIVFNDGQLNQIRLQQLAQYGASIGTDLPALDLALLAAAIGVGHVRTGHVDRALIDAALAAGRPTMIEVPVGDSLAVTTGAIRAGVGRQVRRLVPANLRRRLAALRPT